jgi:hypothetical protein
MSIRIETLDDGYLVVDTRGPRTWRGSAVTKADAELMAENRLNPRLPSPPPGPCLATSGYDEPHPLAAVQYAQATGDADCIGGICSLD